MEIKITYVGKLNGIKGMWCGFKPEGLEVIEERAVLFPSEGKILQRKDDEKIQEAAVWLKDTTEEDWIEIDIPEEVEETNTSEDN